MDKDRHGPNEITYIYTHAQAINSTDMNASKPVYNFEITKDDEMLEADDTSKGEVRTNTSIEGVCDGQE